MTYCVSDTDITELRHFLYKSKSTAQFTCPEYEAPYSGASERAHIFGLYQFMHQRLHSAARPLKILYYVGAKEALLGWVGGAISSEIMNYKQFDVVNCVVLIFWLL